MSADDLKARLRVQQEEPNGCVAATLAMMIGVSYGEATKLLRRQGDCYSSIALQHVLYDRGWAKCEVGRKYLATGEPRETYPPRPFAPVHRVSVKVKADSEVYHSILWLADGTILDPMTPEPRSFADYAHIGGIEGWVPPEAADRIATLEAEVERLRDSLAEVKLLCLVCGAPGEIKQADALTRMIRICIDAGITQKLPDLRAALKDTGHANQENADAG